jgi:hypothetical protein
MSRERASAADQGRHPGWWLSWRRMLAGVLIISSFGLTLVPAAGATKPSKPARQRTAEHRVSIPRSWKSYTYHDLRVSVPADWAVVRGPQCPPTTGPGYLLLGPPANGRACESSADPAKTVIFDRPGGDDAAIVADSLGPFKINGVGVYLVSIDVMADLGIIPSLGEEFSISGPDANRILHTFRAS